MRIVRRRLIAALVAAGAVLLSACGSSGPAATTAPPEIGKSAQQIIQDMHAAMRSVRSFHMNGSVVTPTGTTQLDLTIDTPQKLSGSVTLKGVTARLIYTGGSLYMMGRQFFASFGNAQTARVVGDNWVKMPASAASGIESSFSNFTDTSTLANCFSLPAGTAVTKTATSAHGVDVVQLSSGTYALDVDATGPAYLAQFSGSGDNPFATKGNSACSGSSSSAGDRGSLLFDHWGTQTPVTPPPSSIDLSAVSP